MPRQIIDTESSRPAYVRRRARRWVISLLVFAAIVAAIWFLAHRAMGQEMRVGGGTAHRSVLR
jgi:hypothetical protein